MDRRPKSRPSIDKIYDKMAVQGHPLCRQATAAELADPMTTIDPSGWLGGDIAGRRVLCLAAGGGRHSRLYVAAGAIVTVVDISQEMLNLDRDQPSAIAEQRLRLFQASMDHLPMLRRGEFDVVVQPVSSCYLPTLATMFGEVARVLRPGGLYISQHKSPTSLQCTTSVDPDGRYAVRHGYYTPQPAPTPRRGSATADRLRERGATEYVHRWENLVGGICRAGFVVEDLSEPDHHDTSADVGTFAHRASFVAPYLRIKARRVGETLIL